MNGFFCELRRRKVYRVAAGYGVVGWLLIQFATTVFPALTLPAWTARLVIILVPRRVSHRADSGLGVRSQHGRHRKNAGNLTR
jgi:hypothetical protein